MIRDKEYFLTKAHEIHGDNYIYNLDNYGNWYKDKIEITCKKHNTTFLMNPYHHIDRKQGCKLCGIERRAALKRLSLDVIKSRIKEVWGKDSPYDYKDLTYDASTSKITYRCPIHGAIEQRLHDHLNGHGCKYCGFKRSSDSHRYSLDDFLTKSTEIHNGYYIYDDKLGYVDMDSDVIVKCPKHGYFKINAQQHVAGRGCKECKKDKIRELHLLTEDEAITKAREKHGNKYDYSEIKYSGMLDYIYPICPIHGKFKQKAATHILLGHGCPKCSESKLERIVRVEFEKNNIIYEYEQKFNWLRFKSQLSLDFYLKDINLAIECQGEQHFKGGWSINESESLKMQERDQRKRELCKENGVELIYFLDKKYEEYVKELDNKYFINIDDLIGYIKSKQAPKIITENLFEDEARNK